MLKKKTEKTKKTKLRQQKEEIASVQHYMVEASTHVPGTKDRSVIMLWLPHSWGLGQKALESALAMMLKEDLGLCFLATRRAYLMLCPLALPRSQVVKIFNEYKINKRASILKEREHDWIRISDTMNEDSNWANELEPIGLYGQERIQGRRIPHLILNSRGVWEFIVKSHPLRRIQDLQNHH